jgi:hypothetical protein
MKLTTSLNVFPKRVWAVAVLTAVGAAAVAMPARAQVGEGEANGLIGSWRVTVNVTNPSGFPSFPVLMTLELNPNRPGPRLILHSGGFCRAASD